MRFWDALDAVGVDAYPALTEGIAATEENPSVDELVAAYGPVLKLMSDFYHGRGPPPPPPMPPAPPCPLGEPPPHRWHPSCTIRSNMSAVSLRAGGHIEGYSNFFPHHLVGPDGPNTEWVQYLGIADGIEACEAMCRRRANCTSWTWHGNDTTTSSRHCFARSDGKWMPTATPGYPDACGRVKDKPEPLPCPPLCPTPPTPWWPALNNTPIIWAENGLISAPNSFRHPGGAYDSAHPQPVCTTCQERYYEAFFRAVWCNPEAREWFHGVYWWKWSTDPDPWSDDGAAGNDKAPGNNSDFEPQHKPAQDVLRKYYGGGCPKV